MGDRPPGGPDEVNGLIERTGMADIGTIILRVVNEIIGNYKAKLASTDLAFTYQDRNTQYDTLKSEIYTNTQAIIAKAVWPGRTYPDTDIRYRNGCPLARNICEELIKNVDADKTYASEDMQYFITDMARQLITMYDPDKYPDDPPPIRKRDEDAKISQTRSLRKDEADRGGANLPITTQPTQSKAILQTMDRLLNLL